MKKNILLAILIFFLTGCSVEYNLELNNENLIEEIKIGPFESENIVGFDYIKPSSIVNEEEHEYYNMNYSNKYLNLDYTYSIKNFHKSNLLNNCYTLSNFSKDSEYYYILTSKDFQCLTYDNYKADEVKIKFKTNYNVVSCNADYIEEDTYIWIINESNARNKPIEIKIERNTEKNNENDQNVNKKFDSNYLIFILIILLLFGGTYLYIKIKSKKNDKI